MIETSARLLRLLSLLQAHREWTGGELAQRLGVTPRTVRKDIDRLRQLGYPVDATRGAAGGYRLAAGANLPPLLLADDEAVAVAVGLTVSSSGSIEGVEEASLRALGKLMQVLPSRLRRRVDALRGFALQVPPDEEGPRVASEMLSTLAAACHDREAMIIRYERHDGASGRRTIEPHQLVTWGRRWYLVAWDRERDDWRTFRVDRIGKVDPTARRFRERPLPAEDMTAYIAHTVSRAGWKHQVRFLVEAPAVTVLERINPAVGIVEPVDSEQCVLIAGSDDLWMTAVFIGMLGFDFTVDGPPELIEHFRVLAQRYARAVSPD